MATRDYVGNGSRRRAGGRNSKRAAPKRSFPLIPVLVLGVLLAGFGGFLYVINGKGDSSPSIEEQVRANKPKSDKPALPQEKWSYMERLENKQVDIVEPPPQPGVLPPPPAETVTLQPERLPKPVETRVPQPGTPVTAPKPATGAPVATAQEQVIDRKAERERMERELRAELEREQAEKAKAAAASADSGRYMMQCAALRSQDAAESLKARIAFTAGLSSSLQSVNGANGTVYKVVVGPFNGKAAADAANKRLQASGISGCIPRKQ
ncbi:SPOR domain-containing protein [Aeromonas schubertii]|uniref:SPOR domain-containing protein n=1 Tax=Aeromonas TaxID=642 RepID=UPI00067F6FDF|nr:SPOR domain-containing protein [Aeromonas schubertii]KUE79251.1 cell division protein [Aeromonas schubertii]MBZ6074479.1 SPOR domain-containing protein [Aeromonas schubertii]